MDSIQCETRATKLGRAPCVRPCICDRACVYARVYLVERLRTKNPRSIEYLIDLFLLGTEIQWMALRHGISDRPCPSPSNPQHQVNFPKTRWFALATIAAIQKQPETTTIIQLKLMFSFRCLQRAFRVVNSCFHSCCCRHFQSRTIWRSARKEHAVNGGKKTHFNVISRAKWQLINFHWLMCVNNNNINNAIDCLLRMIISLIAPKMTESNDRQSQQKKKFIRKRLHVRSVYWRYKVQ